MALRSAAYKASSRAALTLSSVLLASNLAHSTSMTTMTEPTSEHSETLKMWHDKWAAGRNRWHKPNVHASLEKFADTVLPPSNKKARVLVPLCGKTVDLAWLASKENVKEVVGVEGIAKALDEFVTEQPDLKIEKVESSGKFDKLAGTSIVLLRGDWFELNANDAGGKFDGIWDRGALVAISPDRHQEYIDVMSKFVTPGGVILLSTYVRPDGNTTKGPPYSIDEDQVRKLYEDQPWVESVECVDTHLASSIEPWYAAIFLYFRGMSGLEEKIFVIKAKE